MTEPIRLYEEFYRHGMKIVDFESKNLNSILHDILTSNLKDDFNLVQKYPGTGDLRPNVIDYDDEFINVLKTNNIHKIINNATLKDMTLYHIQARVSVADSFSYMDWHRDVHYYDYQETTQSGREPPAVKLIYYPQFNFEPKSRLKFLLGSSKTMFYSKKEDMNLIASNYLKTAIISSSNNKAVLFDTSSLHAVVPESKGESSIRLIYSFYPKVQILDEELMGKNQNIKLHLRTSKTYDEIKQ